MAMNTAEQMYIERIIEGYTNPLKEDIKKLQKQVEDLTFNLQSYGRAIRVGPSEVIITDKNITKELLDN